MWRLTTARGRPKNKAERNGHKTPRMWSSRFSAGATSGQSTLMQGKAKEPGVRTGRGTDSLRYQYELCDICCNLAEISFLQGSNLATWPWPLKYLEGRFSKAVQSSVSSTGSFVPF